MNVRNHFFQGRNEWGGMIVFQEENAVCRRGIETAMRLSLARVVNKRVGEQVQTETFFKREALNIGVTMFV
jgi:hypothetical protein